MADCSPTVRIKRKVRRNPSIVFKYRQESDDHVLLSDVVAPILPLPVYLTGPNALPKAEKERAEACLGTLVVTASETLGDSYESTAVRLDEVHPAVKVVKTLARKPAADLQETAVLDIHVVVSQEDIPSLADSETGLAAKSAQLIV